MELFILFRYSECHWTYFSGKVNQLHWLSIIWRIWLPEEMVLNVAFAPLEWSCPCTVLKLWKILLSMYQLSKEHYRVWVLKTYGISSLFERILRFTGNLCRCTGYRPILEAFRNCSNCSEKCDGISDIEDQANGSNCMQFPHLEGLRNRSCDSKKIESIEKLLVHNVYLISGDSLAVLIAIDWFYTLAGKL